MAVLSWEMDMVDRSSGNGVGSALGASGPGASAALAGAGSAVCWLVAAGLGAAVCWLVALPLPLLSSGFGTSVK